MLAEEPQEGRPGIALWLHGVAKVGAVKAGNESLGALEIKLGDDILLHPLRGGGGESHHGHLWELPPQVLQIPIVRPEVVSPLGDAVGLVHGNEAELNVAQEFAELREGQAFRRRI